MRNHVRVRLDLREQTCERHQLDDPQPRDETVLAVDRGEQPVVVVIALEAFEEGHIVLQRDFRFCVQDIDLPRAFRLVTLADLEVVEVVRRGDLDRPGALLGIGIFVGDNRHQTADQRQPHPPADQMPVAFVVGMDGDRRVAEHRLGPRGRDRHPLARSPRPGSRPRDSRNSRDGRSGFWREPWRAPAPSSGSPSSRDHLNEPLHSTWTTSRSEIAVWNFGSQLTRRLSL